MAHPTVLGLGLGQQNLRNSVRVLFFSTPPRLPNRDSWERQNCFCGLHVVLYCRQVEGTTPVPCPSGFAVRQVVYRQVAEAAALRKGRSAADRKSGDEFYCLAAARCGAQW